MPVQIQAELSDKFDGVKAAFFCQLLWTDDNSDELLSKRGYFAYVRAICRSSVMMIQTIVYKLAQYFYAFLFRNKSTSRR